MTLRKSKTEKANRKFPRSNLQWAAIEFTSEEHSFWAQSFIIITFTFLLCAFVYMAKAKIKISVEGTGKIVSELPPVPIKSSIQMTVSEVMVKENDHVKKGAILVKSQESISSADYQNVRTSSISLTELTKQNLTACSNCIEKLKTVQGALQNISVKGDVINLIAPIQNHIRELVLALDERQKLPSLLADSYLEIKMKGAKLAEIKKTNAEKYLGREVDDLTGAVSVAETKIQFKIEKSNERINGAKDQIISALAELTNKLVYVSSQYTVVAPFDGVITNLQVKGGGELLKIGQDLMSIVPSESKLMAEIVVSSRDISEVQKDLETEIAVDSLPEFEFGRANGSVHEILRKERDVASEGSAISSSVFMVRMKMKQQSLRNSQSEVPFIIGMTIKGEIIIREETILNALLKAIFKIRDDVKSPVGGG